MNQAVISMTLFSVRKDFLLMNGLEIFWTIRRILTHGNGTRKIWPSMTGEVANSKLLHDVIVTTNNVAIDSDEQTETW